MTPPNAGYDQGVASIHIVRDEILSYAGELWVVAEYEVQILRDGLAGVSGGELRRVRTEIGHLLLAQEGPFTTAQWEFLVDL